MGKLIKYEIKGTYRYILGVLALVLILTTGIYAYISNTNEGSAFGATFIGLSVLVIFGTALSTFLYIVGSFRKELYDDRGYLTFTLPLTGNQIVGAKLIVSLMWFAILGIVIAVYNIIMALSFSPVSFSPVELNISELFSMIKNMGIPYKEFIIVAITGVISGVTTLILIYLSMALSRVTFRNKKIGGFWFIIFLVLSALITYSQVKIAQFLPYYIDISTFKVGSGYMLSNNFYISTNENGIIMSGDFGNMLFNIPSFIYSILMGVLTFLGTGYLIENKIDL